MPLPSNIVGAVSGNMVEVDSENNAFVTLPQSTNDNIGFANLSGQILGTTGLNQNRAIPVSSEGRPHVALDRPVFYINFAGSATAANAIPQDALKQTATTMTASAGSAASGFLWLNNGLSVATTVGIAYQSYTTFPTFAGYETRYEMQALVVNANTQTGKVIEIGAGLITSGTSAGLLDGYCFRWTAAGTFIGIISINGTEFQTSPLTVPTDNTIHRFTCVVTQVSVEFYVDMVLQATIATPTGYPGPSFQPNPPQLVRVYNLSGTSLPAQIKIAEMWVTQNGCDWQKPWSQIVSGMQQNAANVPFGTAIGESAPSFVNATAYVATGAATNTGLVAGNAAGLGGVVQFNAQASNVAAAGDNIITSYQIPAQTATQASKRLVITGVRITSINTGAVVAGTPTTLLWGLAWGHTAISLATTDAVNAKAPRHTKVGTQSWATSAAVGANATDINTNFTTPIVVNPGEFIASTARFVVGTATSSQSITSSVSFEGYWE